MWVTRHLLVPWHGSDTTIYPDTMASNESGVVKCGFRMLPVFDQVPMQKSEARKSEVVLNNLGDITVCVEHRGLDLHTFADVYVLKVSEALLWPPREQEARDLYQRAMMANYIAIGYTPEEVRRLAQTAVTSPDHTTYSFVGRSETHVVISIRLRAYPERITLLQVDQEKLERRLGAVWVVTGVSDVAETCDEMVASMVSMLAQKVSVMSRSVVEKLLYLRSQLQEHYPNVLEAAEGRLHYMWRRLTLMCFRVGAGGDPNSRLPPSMWYEAFRELARGGDRELVVTMMNEYSKRHHPDAQLVDYARNLEVVPLTREECEGAYQLAVECMKT